MKQLTDEELSARINELYSEDVIRAFIPKGVKYTKVYPPAADTTEDTQLECPLKPF